jgi:ABC-type transport system involved in multi-copper enzyme maturation permease subunit
VGNPILRGDLRARIGSRKILVIEIFYLAVLGLLTFLGLPPELAQIDVPPQAGLATALLVVQAVLVTYFASACAIQEIAVEGEKTAVDLTFGPFAPAVIVAGKSLASFLTILYWLLLGAPLVMLAARIRQEPIGDIVALTAFIAIEAWGVAQVAMLYGVVVESEFSRMLAHWGTLFLIFVGTLALPAPSRLVNPVDAVMHGTGGGALWFACLGYAVLGVLGDSVATVSLRRFASA